MFGIAHTSNHRTFCNHPAICLKIIVFIDICCPVNLDSSIFEQTFTFQFSFKGANLFVCLAVLGDEIVVFAKEK